MIVLVSSLVIVTKWKESVTETGTQTQRASWYRVFSI